MVLYLIGLGLGDERDITVRGLEAVRSCDYVYLEEYTSILGISKSKLQEFYQISSTIQTADRTTVESESEQILAHAKEKNVAFLVVGDPFAATTHHDLLLRAHEQEIKVITIHNASIMNACAATGLQLYHFGQTISIPFFHSNWRPDSFYFKLLTNHSCSFHTLCLLDIKVKECSPENVSLGKIIYEKPRYMTIQQAIQQLFECEEKHQKNISTSKTKAFGLARIGSETQQIISGTLEELVEIDFGPPLHSLVICSPCVHEIEEEMFEYWHWDRENRKGKRAIEKQLKVEREEERQRSEYLAKKADEYKRKLALEAEKINKQEQKKQEEERKAAKQKEEEEEKRRKEQQEDEEETVDIEPVI